MPANKKQPSIDVISALEQFEALIVNTAPIVAEYYKALINNGVPHQLAEDLTRDWHQSFWDHQFEGMTK